jgi:hypothetical protein
LLNSHIKNVKSASIFPTVPRTKETTGAGPMRKQELSVHKKKDKLFITEKCSQNCEENNGGTVFFFQFTKRALFMNRGLRL